VAEPVAEFLSAQADGSPFLVEELLAGLVAGNTLRRDEGGWVLAGELRPTVPSPVGDVVRQRLRGLPAAARSTLHAAAILGRSFDWSLLSATTGLAEHEVLEGLRTAVDAQLVVTDPAGGPDQFLFRHALTREAVLQDLLPPQLAAMAGKALEAVDAADSRLPGQRRDLAAELAQRAGQRQRAARHLMEAGQEAARSGALLSAESTLERARALIADDISLCAEVEEALSDALALRGETQRCRATVEALLTKLDVLGAEPARVAEAHLRAARAATAAADWPRAVGHLAQARLKVEAMGNPGDVTARIDAVAANVAFGQGQPQAAVSLAQRALEAAEAAGSPAVTCEALEVLGRCARLSDNADAERAFSRAAQVADRHGLVPWRIKALQELGTLDLNETLRTDRLAEARDQAVRAGSLAVAAVVDLQLGAVFNNRFEPDEALVAAERCRVASARYHLPTLGMALVVKAVAHAERQDRAGMEAAVAAALEANPDNFDVAGGCWGAARGLLSTIEDDLERALEEMDRGMALVRQSPTTNAFPFRGLWALVRTVLCRDGDSAREEVRASGVTTARRARVYLLFADAVAEGQAGRRERAAEMFAVADDEASMLQGTGWFRRHAHFLVAGPAIEDGWGEPGGWLRDALLTFSTHHQKSLASACRRRLRAAGEPVPRAGRGESTVPASLAEVGVTSREMDVLLLLRDGLPNAEIAQRLYLSPRTVEKHVASLLTKTATRTRTELAARTTGALPPRP
jgi:DNA-binding CsgD family transcriptional regulator/tetratricopeptide (TPR) repeat protein